MKKILLIGGCGYIGSELFLFLQSKNYDVISVDLELFKNPGIKNIKKDFNDLTKEFIQRFDIVILLAAHSSVKMSENDLNGCITNNMKNFIELVQKINKNQKFIFASSSSVYSNYEDKILNEDFICHKSSSIYDFSKLFIDNYMRCIDDRFYFSLRFGTVNGFSLNFRNDIMLNCFYNSFKNENLIKISNKDIKRPILSIKDLCRSIFTIIEQGTLKNKGIYNLASFNSSVGELGERSSKYLKCNRIDLGNIGNPYSFLMDCSKFKNTFSFEFKDTIESILQDISENYYKIRYSDTRK